MTPPGRHRKPRHLTYFECPSCTTRIIIDLDALPSLRGSGIWDLFGCEPQIEWMPKELLGPAELLVEQHETAHGVAA